jgi:hypothetical protein
MDNQPMSSCTHERRHQEHAMTMRYACILLCTPLLLFGSASGADVHHGSAAGQHSDHTSTHHAMSAPSPLTAAGNDAFWAIQEAIQKLDADPHTDWSQVNLEALRQHLVDMQNFTLHVEVLSQTPVAQGMKAEVRPTTTRSEASLERVFAAHPAQLKRETGWEMHVAKQGDVFVLTVTTPQPAEVDRLRGLGYIGVMALGAHHQVHHWGMVRGESPHQ